MSGKGGRPRSFDWAVVPMALEIRDRTGETWPEIAGELGVHPATLRNRVAEYRRLIRVLKTKAVRDRRVGLALNPRPPPGDTRGGV